MAKRNCSIVGCKANFATCSFTDINRALKCKKIISSDKLFLFTHHRSLTSVFYNLREFIENFAKAVFGWLFPIIFFPRSSEYSPYSDILSLAHKFSINMVQTWNFNENHCC